MTEAIEVVPVRYSLDVQPKTRRPTIDVAIVALLTSIRRLLIEQGENTMAQFEKVDAALSDLSDQITKIGEQLAALPAIEDPAIQAKIDEIAAAVQAAADRVDALIETEGEDDTTPTV
jgi:hypothetical protein